MLQISNGIVEQIKYLTKKGFTAAKIRKKLKTFMPKRKVPKLIVKAFLTFESCKNTCILF